MTHYYFYKDQKFFTVTEMVRYCRDVEKLSLEATQAVVTEHAPNYTARINAIYATTSQWKDK